VFKAKAIMTKDVISVHPETPVYEAMKVLVENGISGLPVVDDEGILTGIITEKDVLALLTGSSIGKEETVNDYVTKKVVSFTTEDSVVDICDFFKARPIRRVPIVSGNKLVGIVSRRDVIKLILKSRQVR
jgi:CBS domain-containing protein